VDDVHYFFFAARQCVVRDDCDPFEMLTIGRRALEDTGIGIIEQRIPSSLLDQPVLITGEVDRTTGFEKGFAIHRAWRGESWKPDLLILDDQALIVNGRSGSSAV
jgi:hypothetical protein